MTEMNSRIIVEQNFSVPLSQLWKAISEPDQMRQWFFENIEDFQPEVGFQTQFNVKSGERNFKHLWKLTDVVHLEKIVYLWQYEGYEGEAIVCFETFINEGGSSLRVSHFVTTGFDQSIPEFRRESCQQGWEYFIKDRLKAFLEN
ncbi:uncharacterized protein YndB with AHSA1/START domain [Ancylomarina subtilis]|uniref:Uncharacterized protein YndB with AHSA1/START domain n=1 Tax=Ancylomarina subtilis TaxID=1639035 RepID=A0A4Q7VK32_9BACT|nr:SRPBCC domain-containing protein [Ancylomarina subtilis]RZT96368.1 uncharacterized protein YndB with AHSA1/START domain [Ancylomarina subtilis]